MNVVFALADNATIAFFGLFYIIGLARLLPPADFGMIVLFDVIRNLLGIFSLSIGQAIIKFYASHSQTQRSKILTTGIILNLVCWIFITALILLSHNLLSSVFHMPVLSELLLLMPLLLLFSTGRGIFIQINTSEQRLGRVFVQDLFFLCTFIIISGSVYYHESLMSGKQIIICLIISRIIDCSIGAILSFDLLNFSIPSIDYVYKFWDFSKYSFINSLGVLGFSNADRLLLGLLLSPEGIATYGAGSVIFNLFMVINSSANMLVFPATAAIMGSSNEYKRIFSIRVLYIKWVIVFTVLSCSISIPLALFAPSISYILYKDKYPEAALLFQIFSIWGIVLPMSRVAASTLNGMGTPELNAKYTWISIGVSIFLNIFLINIWGIWGAAYTTTIVAFLLAYFYFTTMKQKLEIDSSEIGCQLTSLIHKVSNFVGKNGAKYVQK